MNIIALIQYGTPVLILGLIISNAIIHVTLSDLKDDMTGVRKGVVWSDTCEANRGNFEARISSLETIRNNK